MKTKTNRHTRARAWGMAIALGLASIGFSACHDPLEVEICGNIDENLTKTFKTKKIDYTNENGVYHVVTSPSYGYQVNIGDTVAFWYVGSVYPNSLVFDTNIKSVAVDNHLDTVLHTFDSLVVVMGDDGLLEGLHNGLLLCRDGQKASIYFNPSHGYGKHMQGAVQPWSTLQFDVEIVHLNSPAIEAEKQAIAAMDLSEYTQHASGLYYKFTNDTVGALPQLTDTVYCWYRCTLPDGTTVEQAETPNVRIAVADKLNTPALKESLLMLAPGRTIIVLAPSPLAYGKKGRTNVSPYQTVCYEIRLDSIQTILEE